MATLRRTLLSMLFLLFLAGTTSIPATASPWSATVATSPSEIIAAVNAFRAAQGLAPYTVDSNLMSYANQHAQYQSSIDTSTHTHSDGTTAWTVGLEENIAAGDPDLLTAEYAVFTIWQDPIHLKPMIGYVGGAAGAGVASNGSTTYFTFNVRPAGAPVVSTGGGASDPNATATPWIPIAPLVTATPRNDGTIWHEVGYGQTLWAIANAYGVEADALCGLNSMEAGCTEIYAGVRLLIRWKGPTPTPNAMAVAQDPTGEAGTPGAARVDAPAVALARAPTQAPASVSYEITPTLAATFTLQAEPAPAPGRQSSSFALLAAGLLISVGGVLLAIIALGRPARV